MGSEEQQPLLQTNPPTYDSIIHDSYDIAFSNAPRQIPVVECRVCHATIDCTGRLQVIYRYYPTGIILRRVSLGYDIVNIIYQYHIDIPLAISCL